MMQQQTAGGLVTPELEALIGKQWPPVTYDVDGPGIRMWARAVGYEDPVYYDEAVARERGFDRIPAPPGFVGWPRTKPDDSEPGPPIRGLHPDLPRSLNGGTEYEYPATIHAGDELEASTKIVEIKERSGSIGRMLLITRETTFRRGDQAVAVMRATVINY